MSSLGLVTAVILISQAKAVTTLGQEEDAFAKLWSHKDKDLSSMKLHSMKQDKSELQKKDNTPEKEKCTSRKCLTENLKLLHNRELIGSRLY